MEEWEEDNIEEHTTLAENRFLKKYAGLAFGNIYDGKDGTHYVIDDDQMAWLRNRKRWNIKAWNSSLPRDNPDAEEWFEIDNTFFGLVHSYYKKHPDNRVKTMVKEPANLDGNGDWDLWIPGGFQPKTRAEKGQPPKKKARKS